jgi:hypothetical protein
MASSDFKRRLAEAEAAIVASVRTVRNQRDELNAFRRRGEFEEADKAQTALEMLEDRLRRHIGVRNILLGGLNAADIDDGDL